MLFLLNEWLFHDLLLENGEEKFQETKSFLRRLRDSEDSLIHPDEPRWIQRSYSLMSREDVRSRSVSRLLHSILRDSDQTVRVNSEEMGLVPEASYEGVPSEDIYLVQAYICGEADLLVTTDEPLRQALAHDPNINCQMREDFLKSYLPRVESRFFIYQD